MGAGMGSLCQCERSYAMPTEGLKPEEKRETDAEFLSRWRSEREGTGKWTRFHYGRSMGIKASQTEITKANAAAKRTKKR